MFNVNMNKNPEQTLEDFLANVLEVLWKWFIISEREDLFIIDDLINPLHQVEDIFWSRELGWCFVFLVILPKIFILGTS